MKTGEYNYTSVLLFAGFFKQFVSSRNSFFLPLVLFLLLQRHFVEGIAGAVK